MQKRSIWLTLLGVEGGVFEGVTWDLGVLRLAVRLKERVSRRCPVCGRQCPGYDHRDKAHVWRALDLGVVRAEVCAVLYRVQCPEHGVRQEAVPWARAGSNFTRAFEDTVAWLAARTNRSAVATLMRVTWLTVGRILENVCADQQRTLVFPAIKRIGVDEVSYRRGHRYITVVVDHDTGRLLFAHPGKDAGAFAAFFEQLGPQACAGIELISMDAAPQWREAARHHCPNARFCMDPFHVVKWVTDALDEIRRRVWRAARFDHDDSAASIKGLRYVLLKNPEHLSKTQRTSLAVVERTNKPLYRAYLLKEQLRQVFKLGGTGGVALLDTWLSWAQRCRIPEIVAVARTITHHHTEIRDALHSRLSNARVEALNTRLQLLTRTAFGFHSARALIALAFLKLGALCPSLPHPMLLH